MKNSKTHFCPRCKQDRLKEWFGDPKAPYAICLSCRVEVNGEKKTEPAKTYKKRAECAICARSLDDADEGVCSKCEIGLNYFDSSPKLLGRAASYTAGKLRNPVKQKKMKGRRFKNSQLQQLIRQQRIDDKERGLRFEHAITDRC